MSGVDLIDLGPRRFRDLPTAIGVFQVRAPGLRTEFPALRALDVGPGNLRPLATSFIGRESAVAELRDTVKAQRLVTLTGVGGVGKTRLALEVAARLADEFPDGVWFFELGAVTDPAAVPDAVAAVLGISQQPGKTVSESVATALEGRVRLLVIDNCEHVVDAAADLIEAFLAHSATVKVLATSREGLGINLEQVFPVPALNVEAGVDSAAVSLFVERAQGIAPDFSLREGEEAAAVSEICRRLDGIPLAIELAASRMASMAASEVRDRLDQRFRLLVGSRRGLGRHHTLRHAVAWSYDLLDDAERAVLDRCSVFHGGFDLQSACAVVESDDEFATLDLLDALVRKSLLVADRSSGRTRFSMLETICQFVEEQLLASGDAAEARDAHARHFAGRENDIFALWDSPRQREAYAWFATELTNLRTAFRWAADQGDLDVAAPIAICAAWVGYLIENYEPMTWAEELIEPARAIDHPRLPALYAVASNCYMAGRIDSALRYTDAARTAISDGNGRVPYGAEGYLGGVYVAVGQPERWSRWCRTQLASDEGSNAHTTACLLMGLMAAGAVDEAVAASDGLIDAAEATGNPYVLAFALHAYGWAVHDADPAGALVALRRGLIIAQDSGNRAQQSHLLTNLCLVEAEYDDPLTVLRYFTVAIGNYHDSGNIYMLRTLLGLLAAFFDRLGRHEPAATVAGFAVRSPVAALPAMADLGTATAHLREVLGDQTYESLARTGEAMTAAEMVACAYAQIDQARTELEQLEDSAGV